MKTEAPALRGLADRLITHVFAENPASWPFSEFVYVAMMLAATLLVFAFALNFAGLFIFFERRIAARIQSRVGPNRVGPNGVIQWAADGIKCLFKEDLIPKSADQILFRLAPYFVVLGMLLAYAALPFSSGLIATDIDIGVLFVLGVTSLVVIGLLMGGWGSNSKWSLLGGMRSAAQVISYEIPAGLAAMSAVVMSGSLSMQSLIKAQGGAPWAWAAFASPFALTAFVIFFIAQLAEGNRTPFDLPEAESELVSGYNTEYSGMRFLMFFLAEFANVWVLCAVSVTLFLGGWQIPFGELSLEGEYPAWLTTAPAMGLALAGLLVAAAVPPLLTTYLMLRYRRAALERLGQTRLPTAGPWLSACLVGVPVALVTGVTTYALSASSTWSLATAALAAVLSGGVAARWLGSASQGLRWILSGGLHGAIVVAGLTGTGLIALAGVQFLPSFEEGFFSVFGVAFAVVRQPVALNGLQLLIFVSKTLLLVFIVIQLRWTLPRLRVDQMMSLCWKYLVPFSMLALIGTLAFEILAQAYPPAATVVRVAVFALVVLVAYRYVVKVRRSYEADRENFATMTGQPSWYPPWRLV